MAKKKAHHERSVVELQEELKTLDKELFLLRNERALQRKVEKPHLFKEKRKEKARILTVLLQKQKNVGAV